MDSHEVGVSSVYQDSLAFLRSAEVQPGALITPESASEVLDAASHEVDKIALGVGPGPELAEALGREQALMTRVDQLEAYRTGESAISNFAIQFREDSALIESLRLYATGETEVDEALTQRMQDRVDRITKDLETFNGDFSAANIAVVMGEDMSPARAHIVQTRLEELAAISNPGGQTGAIGSGVVPPPFVPDAAPEPVVDEGARLRAEAGRLDLAKVLAETPGQYNERKGVALVINTLRELGNDDAAIARFAKEIAGMAADFREQAAKLHGDKREESQVLWAENQLWDRLKTRPVWAPLKKQIVARGDDLAGLNTTLSNEKIMSHFLAFAKLLYPE